MTASPPFTRVYNAGDLGNLACGWRSLIVLRPGRKWITLVDWTTLESARVPLVLWQRLPKMPAVGFSRRRVLAYMRARCKYVAPSATIKEAMQLLRRSPPP
jgi:hypothetical protein